MFDPAPNQWLSGASGVIYLVDENRTCSIFEVAVASYGRPIASEFR